MPSLRLYENQSDLSPRNNGEIVPNFPSEALNGFEEAKLKQMGNTAQEIIFEHLGISLDDKETILSLLTDFQKQIDENDKKYEDDSIAYKKFQEKTLWPQAKALNDMIAQRLPSGWKVHGPSIWSDSAVILERGNKNVQIFLNEKGFQLLSSEHDIYWKEMPNRVKSVNVTFIQVGRLLNQPAPICQIKSNTEHWGLGVLSLHRTHDSGVIKLPNIGHTSFPVEPLTEVIYSKTGKPQYIEVRVPLQEPGLALPDQTKQDAPETVHYVFDLSQGLETGILPAYTHIDGSSTPIQTDIHPQIVVDEDSIMIQFGTREDYFPLEIKGGIMKVAKDGLEAMKGLHPPRSKRVKIIDRLKQASPKLRSIFKKSLLEE